MNEIVKEYEPEPHSVPQPEPNQTCQFCNWTNTGCWNIGESGTPKWICQSCVKRHAADSKTEIERMTNMAREACAGITPTYVCWVEELSWREQRMRQAINLHLPMLKDMANQIISPKDNSMSQLVKQFEKSLGPLVV